MYLYWGSPLAPSSVTGVYIKTKLESMSSTVNKYSSSSAPEITTGLLFHFLLSQLKMWIANSNYFDVKRTWKALQDVSLHNICKGLYKYMRALYSYHEQENKHLSKSHLATPFPGVPPHHATTAWPLTMFPSTSSPWTSRLTTFGIPVPFKDKY